MYGTVTYNSSMYNSGGGQFIVLSLTEAESLSDAIAKVFTKSARVETETPSDTLTKQARINSVAETLSSADVVTKFFYQASSDTQSVGDDTSHAFALAPLLETEVMSAVEASMAIKGFLDFQFMFDVVSYERRKNFSETVILNDWLEIGTLPKSWS